MRKIFLILVLILVCGCSNNHVKESVENNIKEPTEQAVDTINSARDTARRRSAELIISEVELSYTRALYSSLGDNPTLEDVKKYFAMDNAVWENDKITYGDLECSVFTDNNNLKVRCLDQELRGNYYLK